MIRGHEFINFPVISYLVENKTLGKKVLFDLGGRKDYWNYSPFVAGRLRVSVAGIKVDKGVDEILVDADIALESIDSIVWRWVLQCSFMFALSKDILTIP